MTGTATRGSLRVYLGAAPGVGKTYAMLDEGHRRAERGADVVIGLVETHGRAHTADLVAGLEVIPRRTLGHRGAQFTEMDLPAVLVRHPQVALVDELAHTNIAGTEHPKRWQDVSDLLAAGIDVVTTVNIQHLESLNDVVERITGVRQAETVPDEVVRRADQVELIDMSAQALRRRLAHGNVYAADRIDAALTNYFREGNLSALRELALLWVADRVDEALARYRSDNDITDPWPARERVVVAVTGSPQAEQLIRRGARILGDRAGGQLLAVHVSAADGLAARSPDSLQRAAALTSRLGGTFHNVLGEDVAQTVLAFARGVNATHIVVGETARSRLSALLAPGPNPGIVRGSADIDVIVVTHDRQDGPQPARGRRDLSRQRRLRGWLAAVAIPTLAALALGWTDSLDLEAIAMLAAVVAVALIGGLAPALVAAAVAGMLLNYLFTEPRYTLRIDSPYDAAAILLMFATAIAVALVVERAERRRHEAAAARAEADILTHLAAATVGRTDEVSAMLEAVREVFAAPGIALLTRDSPLQPWRALATAGDQPPGDHEAPVVSPVSEDTVLAMSGRTLSATEYAVFGAAAVQLGTLLERQALRAQVASSKVELARSDVRGALLAAVSHDLRSPLAGIKAAVTALQTPGLDLGQADREELLAAAAQSTDNLQALIDNLLDLSRLDAGALVLRTEQVALEDVVPRAVAAIPPGRVVVDVRPSLPAALGDAGLIERIVANLAENAVRYSPPDRPVLITAGYLPGRLVLRVIDHGPGVPKDRLDSIFTAFQRLGDAPNGRGLGLGLAVARGFATAQGGTLEAEHTPGGGLTTVLTLPAAPTNDPLDAPGDAR